MTGFTDEQLDALIDEGAWHPRKASELILQARAERDELRAGLDMLRQDHGTRCRLRAERDAALARVKELEATRDVATETAHWANLAELNKCAAREVTYRERYAELEAEVAELRMCDLRRVMPFIPAERIAENERLRVVLGAKLQQYRFLRQEPPRDLEDLCTAIGATDE